VDPTGIDTPAQLAAGLDELRRRRSLWYSDLTSAAKTLPPRDGRAQTLPRSTLSDMLPGKSFPSREKLLAFLAVCDVHGQDLRRWVSAWERAGVVDLNPPAGATVTTTSYVSATTQRFQRRTSGFHTAPPGCVL
jgi:hypothetical protein